MQLDQLVECQLEPAVACDAGFGAADSRFVALEPLYELVGFQREII